MAVIRNNSSDKHASGSLPDANRDAGEVTREMAVGPLLARANLLRMRGQWEEAIAVCTEALLQAPKSPTAHSVLGDIYEAQGKFDDALQWYGMAVDLAPNRTADREKLDRIVALQRGRLQEIDRERAASLEAHRAKMSGKLKDYPSSSTSGTGGRAAAERTVEWFDRVFPPGRSESIARLVFALCGIIAVLIASAAVFVYTSSGRSRSTASLIAEGGTNVSALPSIAAPTPPVQVIVPPAATPLPGPSRIKPSPAASAMPTSPPSVAVAPDTMAQLAKNLPPGVTVTALRGDGGPAAPYQLEIALPKSVSETLSSTQERIIRGAALAARTLALMDSKAIQITVRASLRESVIAANGSLPTAPQTESPLFEGSVAASAIRSADPAITPTAVLQSQFTGVSWYSQTAPPVDAAPGTGVTTSMGTLPPAAGLVNSPTR